MQESFPVAIEMDLQWYQREEEVVEVEDRAGTKRGHLNRKFTSEIFMSPRKALKEKRGNRAEGKNPSPGNAIICVTPFLRLQITTKTYHAIKGCVPS